MIHVDEEEPSGELESQFNHRKVTFKRNKDVRTGFDMLCEIGRGKFGRVMKCSKKDTGEVFAAKFVTCARREDRRNVEREVEIMNCLKSPRILQLYEAYDNGRNEMCLVTEYIGGGELFDRVIEDEFVLTERACRVFVKQILEGVNYIHRQGIIHLDLKPENILCMSKSGNRVKIIDFGLARKFEPMKKLQILFGTPEFVAPEVVNFEPIGYSTDMWALGVITYVLVSGLSPFMGDTDLETMANVTIAEYDYEDEAFDSVSQEAREFIDSLLVKDQTARATSDACLSHPWIKMIQTSESAEGKEVSPVSNKLAKDNHSLQKTAWDNRDSNYYLFDYKSRTASQLYEMNLTLDPKKMAMTEDNRVEEDTFSFFTPDGLVRTDSELTVNAEGKITLKDSEGNNVANEGGGGLRKRSLDDVNNKLEAVNKVQEENIEYVGLVKRPKTPLITSRDIEAQAAVISERKQSGCGSLPDVISSSVETTELHASRCSLLEDTELLPLDVANEEKEEPKETREEFPLPDILLPDEGETGAAVTTPETDELRVTPTITFDDDCDMDNKGHNDNTILSGVTSSQISEIECDQCDDNMAAPANATDVRHELAKNYTVEDGFERPWENVIASTESVCGTEDNLDDDDESSDISDDDTVDGKSSSSSSFPSESSGIFYKAEYTPPVVMTPPISSHLSIENRDTYWRTFFTRNSTVGDNKDGHHHLQKSRSGCNSSRVEAGGLLPAKPSSMCRSKSDAKIGYSCDTFPSQTGDEHRQASSAILSDKCDIARRDSSNELITVKDTSYRFDIEPEQETGLNEHQCSEPRVKSLEGHGAGAEVGHQTHPMSPSLKEEVFDQPWTEVGGDSPKQAASGDSLSSGVISQEMQDLLTSIQSLGNNESSRESHQGAASSRMHPECRLREKNVDFESLMKEVENQIRFSVTAELLERMANCPSIEQQFLSGIREDNHQSVSTSSQAPSLPPHQTDVEGRGGAAGDTFLGSPPIPDLLQTTVKPRGEKYSSTATRGSPPPVPPMRGLTSPSSPDHGRRVTSLTRPSDIAGSGVTRYPVTPGRVPDMRARVQSLGTSETRRESSAEYSAALANLNRVTSDIENFCDIINTDKIRRSPDKFNEKLERDLADTQIVMKDIEHTVDSFRRHLSLPSGRIDYNENNTSNIKAKRVPYPATSQQGSVSKAKDRFEVRSRESYTPAKSRGTTPFSSRSTRSPSPAVENKKRTFSITNSENCEVHSPFRGRSGTGTKMSLRKRSPSPVVTGKVSSFRSKFEPVTSNVTPASAQTIPRTYRLKARDPQDIFGHNTPPLNSPGNYRFQKLSRDSSGMMSKTSSSSNPSSLSRNPSTSRLPNHFISLEPPSAVMSSEVNKPKINRAQSLRTPRYFSPSDNKNATQNAATYLRSMLPKKMAEESKMRGPFGYNRS